MEFFCFTSKIRVNRRFFAGGKKLELVRPSEMKRHLAQLFPQRKEPDGEEGLGSEGLEVILAETNKSRRLGERLKARIGGC